MAGADEAVERKASVAPRAHSALATAAAAHTVHSSCTASIAAEQCRLAARADRGRRERCAAGGRDGGAPGRLVHRAAACTPFRAFVLCACSFICLLFCNWPLQTTPSMARPTPHARQRPIRGLLRRSVSPLSPLCVQWCAATKPAEPCRTSALHQWVCVELPPEEASTVLSASRARARIATPTDPVACEHPIAHKRKAATAAVIDTEALVCAAARGARRRDARARAALASGAP
jgi:hypothetical protein